MSAAMINVGLMKEGRFSIRNKTTHGYACVSGVANGALSRADRNFNSRNTMKINYNQT
jgi:hypothetical protein